MFLSLFKGWFGEKAATFGMWLRLDARIYQRIDNVIVPTANGTTQVDHILVSPFGIFVIETKNMDGWIFGNERQDKWTQVIFGKKYQFQNPLHQNYRHTKSLSDYLGLNHDVFRSVVFFIGDCEFKTPLPANVLTRGLASYVQGFHGACLSDEEVNRIFSRINALKQLRTFASGAQHVHQLHARYNSNSTCPKCGSPLARRSAKKGKYAGQEFLGCTAYPKCRYIRNL